MLLAMAEQQAENVKSEMLEWIQSEDFEEELAEKKWIRPLISRL